MAMKTPGVYIVEKNAFPNSVVEVATAVPAFIGYTEKAMNGGTSLRGQPWRISSMAEYQRYFGGPPQPHFTLQRIAALDTATLQTSVNTLKQAFDDAATATKTALQAQADSAAGKALKAASDALAGATDADRAAKQTALADAQRALDADATTTALKDARAAEAAAAAGLAVADNALAVAKASVAAAPAPADMSAAPGQSATFHNGDNEYLLSRQAGAAGGRYLMHQAMRHFFQNGGGPCYIVSVGLFKDGELSAGDDTKGLIGGIAPLLKEQEPTMVLVPDAVLLPRGDCKSVQEAMLKHCANDMKNRFAVLDVWGGNHDPKYEKGSCIDLFREDIGVNYLDFAAAYYPWLHTSLVQPDEVKFGHLDGLEALRALVADELELPAAPAGDRKADAQKLMLAGLDTASDEATRARTHKGLMQLSKLYAKVMEELQRLMNVMPPSAAMAGLYTMVDNSRGVWKAPANISVGGVLKPTVEISHADQEDLNVHTTGKSINAIRTFIGEGSLVWGARTLDGNSLDWRYINVRRTMIMLEESCRLAAKAMVFEPNVGNTWVTIKSMISNFLTGIWKRGGLAGAVPDDAFSVHCGLGETMTSEDILEGILRVTVLVAISRPAEFIEITFQQQMQKS